ncbi:hypothetical protein E5676_scaffold306G00060 [Cucumis melo var. makuwa]|uniref:Uncharacterized protein n=1 Tax=Cucumis melo var. makuwa TaxID=1194695 RepID=A0A5D3D3L3_CUCMM|nr:hypothetical protein E5676_scaffold306G00060 [Cucumis melo var. makuwa]
MKRESVLGSVKTLFIFFLNKKPLTSKPPNPSKSICHSHPSSLDDRCANLPISVQTSRNPSPLILCRQSFPVIELSRASTITSSNPSAVVGAPPSHVRDCRTPEHRELVFVSQAPLTVGSRCEPSPSANRAREAEPCTRLCEGSFLGTLQETGVLSTLKYVGENAKYVGKGYPDVQNGIGKNVRTYVGIDGVGIDALLTTSGKPLFPTFFMSTCFSASGMLHFLVEARPSCVSFGFTEDQICSHGITDCTCLETCQFRGRGRGKGKDKLATDKK